MRRRAAGENARLSQAAAGASDREDQDRQEGEAAGGRSCRPLLRLGSWEAAQRQEGAEVVAQGRARVAAGRPYRERAAQEVARSPGQERPQ
jgi:hypothetical protein